MGWFELSQKDPRYNTLRAEIVEIITSRNLRTENCVDVPRIQEGSYEDWLRESLETAYPLRALYDRAARKAIFVFSCPDLVIPSFYGLVEESEKGNLTFEEEAIRYTFSFPTSLGNDLNAHIERCIDIQDRITTIIFKAVADDNALRRK